MLVLLMMMFFFFFNDTATTEIYTLSLHDALPICDSPELRAQFKATVPLGRFATIDDVANARSEEHTSELQSHLNLVCRLLLEKKKITLPDLHPVIAHDTVSRRDLQSDIDASAIMV